MPDFQQALLAPSLGKRADAYFNGKVLRACSEFILGSPLLDSILIRMDKLVNRAVQRTVCLTESQCFIPEGDQVETQRKAFKDQIGDLKK